MPSCHSKSLGYFTATKPHHAPMLWRTPVIYYVIDVLSFPDRFLLQYLHTASNQILEMGMA